MYIAILVLDKLLEVACCHYTLQAVAVYSLVDITRGVDYGTYRYEWRYGRSLDILINVATTLWCSLDLVDKGNVLDSEIGILRCNEFVHAVLYSIRLEGRGVEQLVGTADGIVKHTHGISHPAGLAFRCCAERGNTLKVESVNLVSEQLASCRLFLYRLVHNGYDGIVDQCVAEFQTVFVQIYREQSEVGRRGTLQRLQFKFKFFALALAHLVTAIGALGLDQFLYNVSVLGIVLQIHLMYVEPHAEVGSSQIASLFGKIQYTVGEHLA